MNNSIDEVGQAPPMRFTLQSQDNPQIYNYKYTPQNVYSSAIPQTTTTYRDDSFRTIPTFPQTGTSSPSSGSSKGKYDPYTFSYIAVIAALKSLQNKIKVLEDERNTYKTSVEQIEKDTKERLRQLQIQVTQSGFLLML